MNYFADSAKNNNNGDGLSMANAKRDISAALALITGPVTQDAVINLAGTVASPQTYTETNDRIYIGDFRFTAWAKLIVRPYDWNDSNYNSGLSPYTGVSTWDPTGAKPCVIPKVYVENAQGVVVEGVEISSSESDFGVEINYSSQVTVVYCRFFSCGEGILCMGSDVLSENNYFYQCGIGVVAVQSRLEITGDNFVKDCISSGVVGMNNAQITVSSWSRLPTQHYTLHIRTVTPRKKYAAVVLLANSCLWMEDYTALNPGALRISNIKIISECIVKSKDYVGVMLQSRSVLIGSDDITFSESGLNNGEDTVPADQQFMANADDGSLIVK